MLNGALADGEAEVDELDRGTAGAVRVEDVGGFEVAVDEAVLVRVAEGLADLGGDLEGLLEGLGAAFLEAGAFDELHHEVGHALVLADVVHGDDVRVAEGGGGARLAEEAFAGVADPGVCGENLDRHPALEVGIPGAEDDAHAATADLLVEAVAAGEHVTGAAGRQDGHVSGRAFQADGFRFENAHNLVRILARMVFRAGGPSRREQGRERVRERKPPSLHSGPGSG